MNLLITAALVSLLNHSALAELYECSDQEGKVTHHSKSPCPEGYSGRVIEEQIPSYTDNKPKVENNFPENHKNIEVISRGRLVDLIDHIDYGKYTVFLFYADWCAPCKTVKPELENYAKSQNTFTLKELDVINWENPLVRYYNLAGLPYFIVYGPDGSFVERGPVLSKDLMTKLKETN